MSFKVGDRIRRVAEPLDGAPLGYETEVIEPSFDYCLWYINAFGDRVNGVASNWELVQPASPPSPVRTVTHKEIVPGEYGPVRVNASLRDDGIVSVNLMSSGLSVPELRDAARVFIELADALEE